MLLPGVWGTDRLNIYYNPYTIGSWALGLISISLPFEKYPDLVKEEYQAAPADYAVKIAAYADYSADIYNDGTFVDVSVYPYGADGFANNALRIQIQNKRKKSQARISTICTISIWTHIM